MNFNFVRSTKSVVWIPSNFVQDPGNASQRTPEHLAKNPVYPDPVYYLSFLGKYFFRNPQLRPLRIEQSNLGPESRDDLHGFMSWPSR